MTIIKEDLLKRVIVEQQAFLEPTASELWQREYQPVILSALGNDLITFLTGVRRSGKSFLLKIIKNIASEEKQLGLENFLYINFEDERLVNIESQQLSDLIELYVRLFQPDFNKKIVLLFDEIQYIPHWDRWINRLYEQKKFKIFITGSNASLLKRETGRLLTGRNMSIEIFPLSFMEYLYFFKQEPEMTEKDFYDLQHRAVISKAVDEFIYNGGFPELLKTQNHLILQDYFKDIIQKDIIYRHSIRYKKELKEIAKLIISNPGTILSLKKAASTVGLKNINTVKNYIEYLEESYLVFSLPLFSPSLKKQIYNPNKYYGIDPGLFNAVSFSISENKGPLVENIVFLELKRRLRGIEELFYYKTESGKEIDFLLKSREGIQLFQVCFELSEARTLHREKRAILEAAKELGVSGGIIINGNVKEIIEEDDITISIIPLSEFLLITEYLPKSLLP